MGHGFAIFIVIIVCVPLLAAVVWYMYRYMQAQRLGLPPPHINPFSHSDGISGDTGIAGWFNDKFRSIKNRRTAGGAYEGAVPRGARGGRRGPLDPDEAWDARVGTEADVYGPGGYYEEQELGLRDDHEPYGGSGYGYHGSGSNPDGARGRSRSRDVSDFVGGGQSELDRRYDEETTGRGRQPRDPFDDSNAAEAGHAGMNLRSVSPRPVEVEPPILNPKTASGRGNEDGANERRSIFSEHMS
ncbi:hypothetical protein L228DRAFT_269569 [Xylona heveae TC161]|uniref:Acid phosphatase-like protein n=1 Tax=Xylona heveae (strain CBS 132557 / TC161) TaxID=1328760 RepID=A0A165FMZ1_XYLHT|nr:hypothetical protein L228DRAFT_269569 [Xylona heveae TC161]KZF21173.1 hypothetical protein L228DRAFT_269569 [Xylona heveae TC161]